MSCSARQYAAMLRITELRLPLNHAEPALRAAVLAAIACALGTLAGGPAIAQGAAKPLKGTRVGAELSISFLNLR